jgi:choice-of-anchor A domain-containing protein
MGGSPSHIRTGNSWRAAGWAVVCSGIAAGALVLSLGSAAAVPLPAPLGPCSGPACPNPFPPVNNGDFAGRDDTVNLLVGGDMTVNGRAAEAEGKVVVLGNLLVDKDGGGSYNMGVAGVGSRVPPTTGTDYVTVGGNVTADAGNAILVGGSDLTGTDATGNVRYAGTKTGLVAIDPPGQAIHDPDAAAPFLNLPDLLGSLTSCYATQAATGTVKVEFGTATFTGDGTSMLQVFNVSQSLGSPGSQIGLSFTGIPAGATVLVNMLGPTAYINTYTGGGTGDPINDLGPKLLWSAPTATTVTITGSAQFMGSVMVGNAASTTTISEPGMNGRVYLAGNLVHTGSGGYEIHAYPFNGDMPDCSVTPTPTPTTPTPTPTTTTAAPTPTPTTTTATPTPTPTTATPTPTPTTATPTPTPTSTTSTPTPTPTPTNGIPTPTPTPTTPTTTASATTPTPTAAPSTTAPGPSPAPSPTGSNGGGHLPKTGASGVLTWLYVLLGLLIAGVALNRIVHYRRAGR